MLAAIGKTHHLVLDRGTVARADGLNLARVQRRPVEVLPDQSVACRRGLRAMATELRLSDGAGQGGERFRRLVSRLLQQPAVRDCPPVGQPLLSVLTAGTGASRPDRGGV